MNESVAYFAESFLITSFDPKEMAWPVKVLCNILLKFEKDLKYKQGQNRTRDLRNTTTTANQ